VNSSNVTSTRDMLLGAVHEEMKCRTTKLNVTRKVEEEVTSA